MQQTALAGGRFFDELTSFDARPAKNSVVWFSAIFAAWSFDFLFWGKPPGISFPLFVAIFLVAGYAVVQAGSIKVSPRAMLLLPPILLFSFGFAYRAEPLTLVLDFLGTLGLLALLASDLSTGRWLDYRLTDYIVASVHLGLAGLAGGAADLVGRRVRRQPRVARSDARPIAPVLKGVLLAIPLLIVFGVLLSSADPIFSRTLKDPIRWIHTEKLAEYSFRLFLIAFLSYVMTGVFLHSIRKKDESKALTSSESRRGPIGYVEGSVALLSVVLMFALFVSIQFRYFFAGRKTFTRLGLTYSEYARRGFGELLVVALLTLLLLIGLSLLVRRESERQHRMFSSLSTALVVFSGVILLSAFERLLLYENAYGFSRFRAYAHIFMVWLGIVLLAVVALQWLRRVDRWSLIILSAAIGFTASLNLIGVDALIARSNLNRAIAGGRFDAPYLAGLSSDAFPLLVDRLGQLPREEREELAGLLKCEAKEFDEKYPWQSFNFSRERAERVLHRVEQTTTIRSVCP